MKPFQLIVLPLSLYMVISVIFNNAIAWQTASGMNLKADVPFQIFSSSSPLLLLLTGQFDVLWSLLQAPSADWSILTVLISIITGIFMLLLSLGITVGGSAEAATVGVSNSFGINEQGTKLIQTLGIGLLIWGIATGALGGWESYFNNIASGIGSLFTLILQFTFLAGVVWQTQSSF